MNDVNALWDLFLDLGITTDDELRLATDLCGYSISTMYNVLYCKTELRSLEQLQNEFEIEIDENLLKLDDYY